MDYKTPGVYVTEESLLPPSVAGVSTAIPAFIGYTEKAKKETDDDLINVPARIKSILEYEELFGGAPLTSFEVTENADGSVSATPGPLNYHMYHSLNMFFKNGGGPCYIASVGKYSAAAATLAADKPAKAKLLDGLNSLATVDEPTIIHLTDGVNVDSVDDYYDLCATSLTQCDKLKDRFAIFDIQEGEIDHFRNKIGRQYLDYGAAYYPYVRTGLNYRYNESDVSMYSSFQDMVGELTEQKLKVTYNGPSADAPQFEIDAAGSGTTFALTGKTLKLTVNTEDTLSNIIKAWKGCANKDNFELAKTGKNTDKVNTAFAATALSYDTAAGSTFKLDDNAVKIDQTELYNRIVSAIAKCRVILPPCASVAGIYAQADRDRGVWKAPANYSLAGVTGPTVNITDADQENMNVHTTGKSINAIRHFAGKGTLVWGARTLDGNSNEWRYVSVRRLFNYIEESIQKGTAFAVFEPNTPMTWLKVKTMIATFLEGLWQEGGLAGNSKEEAFFVSVGLGETMTEQDVLEGRMIVKVGIAAVRPAEFIILKFSHKLQQS